MYTRKKTVEMDGVSISIAPLTCGQADSFLDEQQLIVADLSGTKDDQEIKKQAKRLEKLWYQFICDGLNNANPDAKFSVERLKAEFDKPFIQLLLETIKEMSGLVTKQPQGEAIALQ